MKYKYKIILILLFISAFILFCMTESERSQILNFISWSFFIGIGGSVHNTSYLQPPPTPIPTIFIPTPVTTISEYSYITPMDNEGTSINKSYTYVLRGKYDSIYFSLHYGVYNRISSEPTLYKCSRYAGDNSTCTIEEDQQYYLKYLDDPYQKKDLDDLVNSIKDKTSIQDDQARIAISLVQNIPYDDAKFSERNAGGNGETSYPYEVLYDNKGVCEDKSLLLAYLLRGLGYDIVLFDFSSEKHMAVGIKSPIQYSYINSGYAFIESTVPSIPTDSQGDYIGVGKLTSTPQIIRISDGSTFTSISGEYQDFVVFNQLENEAKNQDGMLPQEQYYESHAIAEKYGILFKGDSILNNTYIIPATTTPEPTPSIIPNDNAHCEGGSTFC